MKPESKRRLLEWGYFADNDTEKDHDQDDPSFLYGWAQDASGTWNKNGKQTLINWTLKDYQNCVAWLEINKALVLHPSERAWLLQITNTKAWMKNYRLYLDILKVPFDAEEKNLENLVKKTFDTVVSRSIEEYYANEDMPCQLINGALNETEQLLDAETIHLAKQVLGQDLSLTVEETCRVLRSRLIDPGQNGSAQQLTEPNDICRLVCQKKMNQIQTVINETIAGMQKITADVATDFRQGKVGF
ncbi:putative carnitine deficiency-associated protein [Gregarina niphandrodes]|uniref:Carnitine deficiency-associated protein n=1 Tax=Gregarina niphandrodes TaxID=110365 RepID=A0A023BAB5_GRENI|nr:putative carnitine deficiency-associated protein [Gregarina niphandrodes]EZG78201.1 putative carnitine deficiency-associated protein [Gregarina niphandrodes]|eukprot:XP_011129421.1 putative carnitine deficiency-associated protein [Gregarina niphandrodes]